MKEFLSTNLLIWKELIFFGKNYFLLEIIMLKSRKVFCWQLLFSVLENTYFCAIWKVFLFHSKMGQKRMIFDQNFGSISKYAARWNPTLVGSDSIFLYFQSLSYLRRRLCRWWASNPGITRQQKLEFLWNSRPKLIDHQIFVAKIQSHTSI